MSASRKNDSSNLLVTCGCFIVVLIVNLLFGGWATTYILTNVFNKTIAFGWATVIGAVGGEFVIPAAVIVWLLKQAGII